VNETNRLKSNALASKEMLTNQRQELKILGDKQLAMSGKARECELSNGRNGVLADQIRGLEDELLGLKRKDVECRREIASSDAKLSVALRETSRSEKRLQLVSKELESKVLELSEENERILNENEGLRGEILDVKGEYRMIEARLRGLWEGRDFAVGAVVAAKGVDRSLREEEEDDDDDDEEEEVFDPRPLGLRRCCTTD
jgi:hypothetical protein